MLEIHIDPQQKYTDADPERLIEACGYLPSFILSHSNSNLTFKQRLEHNYPFGCYWSDTATVTDTGTYQYPGDEDLHPYMLISDDTQKLYIYPYAMVALVSPEHPDGINCRMD